jgi:hypothetical protein
VSSSNEQNNNLPDESLLITQHMHCSCLSCKGKSTDTCLFKVLRRQKRIWVKKKVVDPNAAPREPRQQLSEEEEEEALNEDEVEDDEEIE